MTLCVLYEERLLPFCEKLLMSPSIYPLYHQYAFLFFSLFLSIIIINSIQKMLIIST